MVIKSIILQLRKYVMTPEAYAKYIGVKIGNNCLIATRNWSSEPYLISIGNNVQLTNGVSIHTHGGGNSIRQYCPNFDVFGKVIIEDWAYVGAYSQIMPGVTIGKGSIVAAGSIVTRSVPPNTIVGGNPARVIGTVEDYIQRNLKYNIGSKELGKEEKRKLLLSLPDAKFIKK